MGRLLLLASMILGLITPIGESFAGDPVVLLEEDFEDGVLDPRFSIISSTDQTDQNGTPHPAPDAGIKEFVGFGSTHAFGFGTTYCPMDCFNTGSALILKFDTPLVVTSLSFKEMEIGGNWGSTGGVRFLNADGYLISTELTLGNEPHNDGTADETFRTRSVVFSTPTPLREIRFAVGDVAQSELFIDDLQILGDAPTPVNKTTWGSLRAKY